MALVGAADGSLDPTGDYARRRDWKRTFLPIVVAGVALVTVGVLLTLHLEHRRAALLRSGVTVPAKILSVSGNTSLKYDVSYQANGRAYTTTIRTGNGHRASSLTVTYDPGDPSDVTTGSADSVGEDVSLSVIGAGVLCLALLLTEPLRRRIRRRSSAAARPGGS